MVKRRDGRGHALIGGFVMLGRLDNLVHSLVLAAVVVALLLVLVPKNYVMWIGSNTTVLALTPTLVFI